MSKITKYFLTGAIIFVLGLPVLSFNFARAENTNIIAPQIKVLSPNGGETWEVGKAYDIKWSSLGLGQNALINIKLHVFKCYPAFPEGTVYVRIAEGVKNTGVYHWVVPTFFVGPGDSDIPLNDCLAKIYIDNQQTGVGIVYNTVGFVSDESDGYFRIINPASKKIRIISPNGGEHWTIGKMAEVRWEIGRGIPEMEGFRGSSPILVASLIEGPTPGELFTLRGVDEILRGRYRLKVPATIISNGELKPLQLKPLQEGRYKLQLVIYDREICRKICPQNFIAPRPLWSDVSDDFFTISSGPRIAFKDVPPSYWAYEEIMNVTSKNIIDDTIYSDSLYQPDKPVTRGEAVYALFRGDGVDLKESLKTGVVPKKCAFPDLFESHAAPGQGKPHIITLHQYSGYIVHACKVGVVGGRADGKFYPQQSISRAEMAVIVGRYKNLPLETPETPTFSDVPKNHWAYAYIEAVNKAGLMVGYINDPKRFGPQDPLTRAQLAVVIDRIFGNNLKVPKANVFIRVLGRPVYEIIKEALQGRIEMGNIRSDFPLLAFSSNDTISCASKKEWAGYNLPTSGLALLELQGGKTYGIECNAKVFPPGILTFKAPTVYDEVTIPLPPMYEPSQTPTPTATPTPSETIIPLEKRIQILQEQIEIIRQKLNELITKLRSLLGR